MLQLKIITTPPTLSCDLLSFFDLLIFVTAFHLLGMERQCCDLLSFFDLLIFVTACYCFKRDCVW
ncbi:MAG: hypothetical protein N2167_10905, partial [Flavobacteriales bacterium]|nr:hypothetical protein [Flavobacteriales bacterium]